MSGDPRLCVADLVLKLRGGRVNRRSKNDRVVLDVAATERLMFRAADEIERQAADLRAHELTMTRIAQEPCPLSSARAEGFRAGAEAMRKVVAEEARCFDAHCETTDWSSDYETAEAIAEAILALPITDAAPAPTTITPTGRNKADGWTISVDHLTLVQKIAHASFGWWIEYLEQVEAVILAHQQCASPPPAPARPVADTIEAGAKILAAWLGYSWEGMPDRDISDRFRDFARPGEFQGGKPALRKMAARILGLGPAQAPAVDVAEVLAVLKPLAARLARIQDHSGPYTLDWIAVETAHAQAAAALAAKLKEQK